MLLLQASSYIEDPRNEGTETKHRLAVYKLTFLVTLRTRGTRGLKQHFGDNEFAEFHLVTLRTREVSRLKWLALIVASALLCGCIKDRIVLFRHVDHESHR